jgi:nucleoside-diphosphate-sugar epimerase
MSDVPAVAVTGANGFVGSAVCRAFASAGYRVIALQRSHPRDALADSYIPYSLGSGLGCSLPGEVVAVVHCAYDLRARDRATIERVNVGGTERLLEQVGCTRVILISSMSASTGSPQIYGRSKLACEELVKRRGGTVLRLGLVYDDAASGGMIGALRAVAGAPVVPMPYPDPFQYTVHIDDMSRCVVSAVADPPRHGVLGVAHPRQVPLSEIIRALRKTTSTAPLRSMRVRTTALHRVLCLGEAMGLRINFRADSVIGLMHPALEVPHVDHWRAVGILLRDFTQETPLPISTPNAIDLIGGS